MRAVHKRYPRELMPAMPAHAALTLLHGYPVRRTNGASCRAAVPATRVLSCLFRSLGVGRCLTARHGLAHG